MLSYPADCGVQAERVELFAATARLENKVQHYLLTGTPFGYSVASPQLQAVRTICEYQITFTDINFRLQSVT